MLPVFIDTSSLSASFNLSKEDVGNMMDQIIGDIIGDFANVWRAKAGQRLKQTRDIYQNSIKEIFIGEHTGAVILDYRENRLVRMVEEGVGAYDMKPNFQNSPKAKKPKNRDGWYLTIPFRHGTPDSLAESSVFAGKMPKEVYNKVKNRSTDRPIVGGFASAPLSFDDLPRKYQEVNQRWSVSNMQTKQIFPKYQHKSPIFEGLVKIKDKSTGQNRYMTFRRVSDLSDENSWVHSGIIAGNFGEKAYDEFQSMIPQIAKISIDNFLNSL